MKQLFFILLICITAGCSAQKSKPASIETWKITDVEKLIASSDKPLVINFWATFCKPCIEEIPYFQEAVKEYKSKNVELILVSLDLPSFYPDKIKTFAAKHNFTSRITWLDESDADYFCPKVDQKWSGAIPATLFVNPKTGYRAFFEDQLSKEKFTEQLLLMTKE